MKGKKWSSISIQQINLTSFILSKLFKVFVLLTYLLQNYERPIKNFNLKDYLYKKGSFYFLWKNNQEFNYFVKVVPLQNHLFEVNLILGNNYFFAHLFL